MTPQDKAEAVLAAMRGEVECPRCHTYGPARVIAETGKCEECYQKVLQRALAKDTNDQRRRWEAIWQ